MAKIEIGEGCSLKMLIDSIMDSGFNDSDVHISIQDVICGREPTGHKKLVIEGKEKGLV